MFSTLKKKRCQIIFSIRINSEAFPIISDGTLENTSPVLIRKLCGSSAMSTNHFTNCLDFVSFSLLSAFSVLCCLATSSPFNKFILDKSESY